MLDRNAKLAIAGLSVAFVVNLVDTLKIYRELLQFNAEAQERELDRLAMSKAHDTMIERINAGYYDDNPNFYADYTREVEFEKIAIRLQD